jgi:hypothetical protein
MDRRGLEHNLENRIPVFGSMLGPKEKARLN